MGFYEDIEKSLLEAIEIEKGNIPLAEKENMPAPTFVAQYSKKDDKKGGSVNKPTKSLRTCIFSPNNRIRFIIN